MRLQLLLASSLFIAGVAAAATACSSDPPAVALAEGSAATPASAPAPSAEPPHARAQLKETKFGQPLGAGDTVSLASIVADPSKFAGKQVKTEGVVKSVCKAAGCWMEIEDAASGRAHVKMAGHGFYVPKNCDGHRAIIEGTVAAGAPADTCASKDSCGGEGNGALAKLEIAAVGVEFVD